MKELGKLLKSGKSGSVSGHIKRLAKLNQALLCLLPEEIRDHVQVANLDKGVLHLMVDNPAWSTRLRYMESDILPDLNKLTHIRVRSIKTRTRPFNKPTLNNQNNKHKKGPKRVNINTARSLSEAANFISDSDLSQAMKRLAKNLEDNAL